MILNVSGRCDIPAYFSDWFFNRLEEGFVDVRNPYNEHQISRIYLNKEQIDAIIFCTKNPLPMLERIDEIPFPFMFHVTLTPYHNDIEPNLPEKKEIINAIKKLSEKIGKKRIVVRYDPILINSRYTLDYHVHAFEKLCESLEDYVDTYVISFLDDYQNTRKNKRILNHQTMTQTLAHQFATCIYPTIQKYHISVQTCAESSYDLSDCGIIDKPCFSKDVIEKITGHPYADESHKGVRKQCSCIETVDIGDYNCCMNGCRYCYANYDEKKILERMMQHNPTSSVLIGTLSLEDKIIERKSKKVKQISLF